jgi:hypothetical protein
MRLPLAIDHVLDADQQRINGLAVRIFAQNFSRCSFAQLLQRRIHPSSCFVFITEDSQRVFPGSWGDGRNGRRHTFMILHLLAGEPLKPPERMAGCDISPPALLICTCDGRSSWRRAHGKHSDVRT